MTSTERPVALTLRKNDIVVTSIGNHAVMIQNRTQQPVPVFFYVGVKEQPPEHAAFLGFVKAILAGPKS